MNIKKTLSAGLLSALASASLVAMPVCAANIELDDVRVRMPIPGKRMTAAFMNMTNKGAEQRQLVSASAPWASRIELHTHVHDKGVMRMRQVQAIDLPVNEAVSLQPGGLHLMIFGIQPPLADTLDFELCFDDGSCMKTSGKTVDIRK